MQMTKGYIWKAERDAAPNDDRDVYYFCNAAENAGYWSTRDLAETKCRDLNRGVTIPTGGTYVCTDFHIEKQARDKFLIYCEAPFDFSKTGSTSK